MATTAATNPNSIAKPSVYVQDMNEVKKVFERFDSNGDGKISREELAGVMKALGSDSSPDKVSSMMEEIDADKDGFVNLQEFAGYCKADCESKAAKADDGAKELREVFQLYDQDHNGLISAVELHKILTRLGERCTVQDCEKMIKSVDSDGDGYVSFEELKKMMSSDNKKIEASQ